MTVRIIQQTMRRMMQKKEQLDRNDALRLRELILADGYVSRGERKVLHEALHSRRLDDSAWEILTALLHGERTSVSLHSNCVQLGD
jgi:hypothetical protein